MKKVSRIITSGATLALAAVLAACGGSKGGKGGSSSYEFDVWTGFGSDYTSAIEGVIAHYNNLNSGKIHLTHTRKKDYNTLRTEVLNSRSQKAYPNFTCGYPDHFADYNEEGFLVALDPYIERYDEEHGLKAQNKSIIDDYMPEYMEENQRIAKDDDGNWLTVGVPFNKSTEVMVVNGYYLDYFHSFDPDIVVPKTWDELSTISNKVHDVIQHEELTDLNKKFIVGTLNSNNTASGPWEYVSEVPSSTTGKVVIDISELKEEQPFYTLGYDSGENAFITLLHQWGVDYTVGTADGGGKALFWKDNASKAATTAVLSFYQELSKRTYEDDPENPTPRGAFAVPATFGGGKLFCTEFLEKGRCLFTVGSSGGLSKPKFTNRSLRIEPIPYKSADKKLVISQGTSLGLLNKYKSVDTYYDEMYNAFCAMVDLTTGDLQAEWVTTTGYFPASNSAYNSDQYQDLLHNENPTRLEQLYRDAGTVNSETYTQDNGWKKFVDPGFPASNSIRVNVGDVFKKIFAETSIEDAMNYAWSQIDDRLK